MSAPFPLGLPASTALYYTLYMVTLALHAVSLAYVLAGSGYLAVAMLRRAPDPAARLFKEWLPFALGATITAGVAPLLFLQILYKTEFYSSSLLLSHRWMSLLPVLIVGFYLLYLMKSELGSRASRRVRTTLAAAAFLCFAFVGYAWTENHLLASTRDVWAAMYRDGRMLHRTPEVAVRFLVWICGSLPIAFTLAGWQLRLDRSSSAEEASRAYVRLAKLSIAGMIAALAAAIGYHTMLEPVARTNLLAPAILPHVVLGALGFMLALGAQLRALQQRRATRSGLITASAGLAAVIFGAIAVREAIRTARVELDTLAHAQIAAAGGFPLFVLFFLINAALIAACIVWVRRARS